MPLVRGGPSIGSVKTEVASSQMVTPAQVELTLGEAQLQLNAGNGPAAAALCQQILARVPGQPHALHMLGLIAFNAGNVAAAIDALRQACQSEEALAVYHSNLAEMLRQQGQLAEAEGYARKAIALAPDLAGAWNNLGIVLQESGQLEEARNCLQRVVASEPGNASAHNNLGNTLKRLDEIAGAERHWRRALELEPAYAEPLSNLANLFREQGQYDLALDHGQAAIRLNPGLLDAYINLAAVESGRFRYRAAQAWLDRVLQLAPNHTLALAARAMVHKELDQLDAALVDAERAASLRPDDAETQSALAAVLLAHGRFDEAVAAFDRALAVPSAIRERVLVSRAMALQENGQSEAALTELHAIVAEFPRSAAAWHGRADIVKFSTDDPAIATMEALLDQGGLQAFSDRMSLHFALGKAYLDSGESDAAFRHLDRGNAMKRSTITYDPGTTSRWLQDVAEAFGPALFNRLQGGGAGSALPIFIVGMPRSGTTLIEQILASHPAVKGAGELRYVSRLVDAAGGSPALVQHLDPAKLEQMGAAYLALAAPLAEGRQHVVAKMPANFIHAGLIHLMLPNARIIHARRNPVDTCLSCYSKLFGGEQSFAYEQVELGQFHRDYQTLMAHWRGTIPPTALLDRCKGWPIQAWPAFQLGETGQLGIGQPACQIADAPECIEAMRHMQLGQRQQQERL